MQETRIDLDEMDKRLLAALQRNVDTTRELGFVKKKIDINSYADLTLVQEAAKRLK